MEARKEYIREFSFLLTPHIERVFFDVYEQTRESNKVQKLLLKDFQQNIKRYAISEYTHSKEYGDITKNKRIAHVLTKFNKSDTDVLHACVLETARQLWKMPFLLYHKVNRVDYQLNLGRFHKMVKDVIKTVSLQYMPLGANYDNQGSENKTTPDTEDEPKTKKLSVDDSEHTQSPTETRDNSDAESDVEDELATDNAQQISKRPSVEIVCGEEKDYLDTIAKIPSTNQEHEINAETNTAANETEATDQDITTTTTTTEDDFTYLEDKIEDEVEQTREDTLSLIQEDKVELTIENDVKGEMEQTQDKLARLQEDGVHQFTQEDTDEDSEDKIEDVDESVGVDSDNGLDAEDSQDVTLSFRPKANNLSTKSIEITKDEDILLQYVGDSLSLSSYASSVTSSTSSVASSLSDTDEFF